MGWNIRVVILLVFLMYAVLGFGVDLETRAADTKQSSAAPVDLAKLDRVMQEMVEALYAQANNSGAKSAQTKYIRLEGVGWESPDGDVVGSSALGALLNERLTLALSSKSVVLSPEDSDFAKGFFGTIVRGAFKVVDTGVRISLRLIDRNTGGSLSEVTRMLGIDSISGIAGADIRPPGAQDAQDLGVLIRNVLGGSSSDFDLRITTDRGNFGTYTEGEQLVIYLESEVDCYVRVYHVSWDDRTLTLIFPNKSDRKGVLRGGEVRRIPPEPSRYKFEAFRPYGVDAIVAVASLEPFGDEAQLAARWSGRSQTNEITNGDDDDDEYAGNNEENVERVGDYLVLTEVDEERVGEVVAKGLILKHNDTDDSGPGSYDSDGEDGSSSYVSPQPSQQARNARATCYFVTVRGLF